MSQHLQRELEQLMRDLLSIGAMVQEGIKMAIVAFNEYRSDLANEVLERDKKIDQHEVEVEEECLKLLALHQPVAEDLRFITAVMKINNDLERMGDGAVSIAKRTLHLTKEEPFTPPEDLKKMADLTTQMVRDSLNAFVKKDAEFARQICVNDDQVDVLHRSIIRELRKTMKENPNAIESALDVFTTTRRLERIADLATNIAEDVVYMVEGEIIRHRGDELPRPNA